MTRITPKNDRLETLEFDCSNELQPYATATTKSARRVLVMKAAEPEVQKAIETPKPKASEPTNRELFHSLSPKERKTVMESQSNNISRFLQSIDYKGIELE